MIRSEVLNAMDRGPELTQERIKAFLGDLSELSIKHGITIGGCGCCGSPSLDDWGASCVGHYFSEEDGQNVGWESTLDHKGQPNV
jgi:hypothetical protein